MKILLILFRLIYLLIFGIIGLIAWPMMYVLELLGFNPSVVIYRFNKFDNKIKGLINGSN